LSNSHTSFLIMVCYLPWESTTKSSFRKYSSARWCESRNYWTAGVTQTTIKRSL